MYAKILVPLDGSALAERALPHACEIARSTGAEVILVQIVRAPLGDAPEAGQTEEDRAIREAATEAQEYLGKIAGKLGKEGCAKVRADVLEGSAAEGILGLAHKEDVDVIIMSTHGRSGVSKLLMGSVAEKVMLTTKRPVMLVKPERTREKPHIEEVDVFLSAH
ncbi:MAG TPA: universal stress protein [Candidatus Deferrimicrobiaceae bacterium]|nr:universal stress protein [Candidatus Deferrimicrobiaceae bacterium]